MSVPSIQLRNGPITWTADLAAAAANSSHPSGASAGVPVADGTYVAPTLAGRVHVKVVATAASGTLSFYLHLYGYDTNQSDWFYLASLNQGLLVSGDSTKYGSTALAIRFTEVFTCSGENYTRYATRLQGLSGGTPSVSTWIGIEKA